MNFDFNYLLILLFFSFMGYLIGSVPFGLVLTKMSGLGDIRNIGSGNIGATNVLRTGNKKIAFLTLILDGSKGALALFLLTFILTNTSILSLYNYELIMSVVAISSILGHCFPIWLNFKGGKGVATGFGTILFFNLIVGIIALIIWVLIAKLFKISSMSALISYFLIPFLMIFNSAENYFIITSIFISSICWFQHRENIKRLLNRTEPKI
ncbi:glycerol-3-phosphate 1-O-acyltransferase PlsY [Alphaproteobacteria bacterium]|nr:glycerol-3-phosphate 1-O-acyltransferase PlsY [Alphaproteobacteria bacterium]